MGRIRGKPIKNLAKKFVEFYPDKFSNNFEDNKKMLDSFELLKDKSTRNKVAGYIVDVVKKRKVK
jgi:small subunit ribosomal protein S17e